MEEKRISSRKVRVGKVVSDKMDKTVVVEIRTRVKHPLYGKIMNHPGMVAYNEAKTAAEAMVNYIDAIINTAMNGGDPMTVQEPSESCTGSCSTCGGCH